MNHEGYRIRLSPGVRKLNFPDAAIIQAVDTCLRWREKEALHPTKSSTHPMMMIDPNYGGDNALVAGWKVGVVIFPVEKAIGIAFPEETPSVKFDFYDVPAGSRPN